VERPGEGDAAVPSYHAPGRNRARVAALSRVDLTHYIPNLALIVWRRQPPGRPRGLFLRPGKNRAPSRLALMRTLTAADKKQQRLGRLNGVGR
jgi:hypothetical protein